METAMSVYEIADEWLRCMDRDQTTRAEVEDLLNRNDEAELKKIFTGRLTFGTAGLRAQMGAGLTRMNTVTVMQASQGLAWYILQKVPDAKLKGVVIGRDARHNSLKFARTAATAFQARGIKVYWWDRVVATPLVPFAVLEKGAVAGIMITASHNPKQDNGYKVYWSNGCQIIPPHDVGIAEAIEANSAIIHSQLTEEGPLFQLIEDKLVADWCDRIVQVAQFHEQQLPRCAYTAMHGVGGVYFGHVMTCLANSEKPLLPTDEISDLVDWVPAQLRPDPDFSTVQFPNPEERGALDLAVKTADEKGNDLILANDPDADRMAVAVRIEQTSTKSVIPSKVWYQFTGNEVGILLASYVLELYRNSGRKGKLAMLCSTVSSGMLKAMAKVEGFHFVETLTGFKWIGNIAQQLRREGYDAFYGFEEALGYMFTEVVYDKDGIAAAAVFLAATSHWQSCCGMTPYEKLQSLYKTYGYFSEANTYLISPGPEVTRAAFEAIRASDIPHPKTLGSKKILQWRDLTVGYDSSTIDHNPTLPVDPSSQMITCELEGDVRFTARGSGTEPKIKLYVESKAGSHEAAKAAAVETQKLIVSEWFSPQKYGLKPAA